MQDNKYRGDIRFKEDDILYYIARNFCDGGENMQKALDAIATYAMIFKVPDSHNGFLMMVRNAIEEEERKRQHDEEIKDVIENLPDYIV